VPGRACARKRFYDIVVQVASSGRGPIVGQMVNPFLLRRQGREEGFLSTSSLEPVLKRDRSVCRFFRSNYFVLANARGQLHRRRKRKNLRRAMGFKRFAGAHERKSKPGWRAGMTHNGISVRGARRKIILSINPFALLRIFPNRTPPASRLIGLLPALI